MALETYMFVLFLVSTLIVGGVSFYAVSADQVLVSCPAPTLNLSKVEDRFDGLVLEYEHRQDLLNTQYQEYLYTLEDEIVLSRLAREFMRTHTFDAETYNCVNMSRDFETWLDAAGISAEVTFRHSDSYGHMWNRVCMDYDVQKEGFVNYRTVYSDSYPVDYLR